MSRLDRAARDVLDRAGGTLPDRDLETETAGTGGGLVHGAALVHTGPSRHSVHVDRWPSDGPDVAPAECAHGYGSGCPDCDVPSYWPSALDREPEPDE